MKADPYDAHLESLPVVFDIDDAPLDEIEPLAGTDLEWHGVVFPPGGPTALSPSRVGARMTSFAPKVKVVHFYRAFRLGSRPADDVVAVKRAVSVWAAHAGHPEWFRWKKVWTNVPGPLLMGALARFQRRHNLPVTRAYDRKTHALLAPYFDAYGAQLLSHIPEPSPQQKLVAAATWGYHNRGSIHYQQLRPIDGHRHPWKLPLYTDCSGSVTDWYEWKGLPDPNGFGFNGLGYTGTLANHGRPVSLVQVEPGDLCFYGWDYRIGAYMHVTIAVSRTRCISHGGESGPSLLPLGPPIGGTLHTIHRYI